MTKNTTSNDLPSIDLTDSDVAVAKAVSDHGNPDFTVRDYVKLLRSIKRADRRLAEAGLKVKTHSFNGKIRTIVSGDTYPVKDVLKALGARWEPTFKGWGFIPIDFDSTKIARGIAA